MPWTGLMYANKQQQKTKIRAAKAEEEVAELVKMQIHLRKPQMPELA